MNIWNELTPLEPEEPIRIPRWLDCLIALSVLIGVGGFFLLCLLGGTQ